MRLLKITFPFAIVLFCFLIINNSRLYGQFVQIESILVDACDGTIEGENEMVSFRVESSPVSVSDIRVDGAGSTGVYVTSQWPNPSNLFLGWVTGGTAEYTTAKSKIDGINASIIHCGYLRLMTSDSVIPVGKKGLIITSTAFTPTANDFTLLSDTLYVIFQKSGNTQGHFVNYASTSSMRYLRLHQISTGTNEDVSYDRSLLVMISGAIGQEDGAGVRFTTTFHTDNETDTYYNDGCQAPYIPLDPSWTAPPPMCPDDPAIDLNSLVTGTTGGTWSGTGVAGSLFNPSGLNGTYSITYTVGTSLCQITNFTESHDITVNAGITPTFTALGPYCVGATPGSLLTTSNNGVTGTWNPATISTGTTGTTNYTFTPAAGQCASTTTISVTVSSSITPTFAPLGPYCVGATPDVLPTTSLNSITGTWNPATISTGTTGTTAYTFTPAAGQCASTTAMSVTVSSSISPTFTPLGPYCVGAAPDALPTTSLNSITGTWNPATISTGTTGTTAYTFTPAAGQCASTTTMSVTVSSSISPTFTPLGPYCVGATADVLPTTSMNSITGTWSPSTISTTSAGTSVYTFTPDAGQCATSITMQVDVNSNPVLSVSATDEFCGSLNGTATVTASGSCSSGFSYTWDASPAQTLPTASNLGAGLYTVTVSCGTCSSSISVTVNSSPGLSINIDTVISSSCNASDGGVNISISGGTSPFSFEWNSTPIQYSQNLQNVPAGIYSVIVTDASGCSNSASVLVNNIAGPVIQVLSVSNSHCGQADGGVDISVSGGTMPYTYLWNSSPTQNGQDLQNVVPGNYSITVVDSLGCMAVSNVTIDDSPGPTLAVFSSTEASCGSSDGGVSVLISDGIQPFTFLWNSTPPQTTQYLTGVPAGDYTLIVTDSTGCSDTITATVPLAGNLNLTLTSNDETCGQMNGSVSVSVTGGSGNYSYLWNTNPAQTTSSINGLSSGSYYVTVYDGGCSATAGMSITNTPGPAVYITIFPRSISLFEGPVSFTGNSNGQIVSWEWSLGDGSSGSGQALDHEYTSIGSYLITLTATDINGCVTTITDTVFVNDIFTLYIPNTFTPDGDGMNDLFLPLGVNVDTNDFYMSVYDRWGELIFETTQWGLGWNGTKYNEGTRFETIQDVYVYRIAAHKVKGTPKEFLGRVTVLK